MDVAVCVGIPYMKDDLYICETLRILSIKNICANMFCNDGKAYLRKYSKCISGFTMDYGKGDWKRGERK